MTVNVLEGGLVLLIFHIHDGKIKNLFFEDLMLFFVWCATKRMSARLV